ncbi:uncharacterized protein LOC135931302 isoform X1 [Gordionus sp. m RMFG-2023]|uniref:uncharacterized protein LOC135931302 isoform X1 n=1 Tax=Gordionus sp. m RMFG-2023 TaxID=3053472 RepID=UPI0031FBAF54
MMLRSSINDSRKASFKDKTYSNINVYNIDGMRESGISKLHRKTLYNPLPSSLVSSKVSDIPVSPTNKATQNGMENVIVIPCKLNYMNIDDPHQSRKKFIPAPITTAEKIVSGNGQKIDTTNSALSNDVYTPRASSLLELSFDYSSLVERDAHENLSLSYIDGQDYDLCSSFSNILSPSEEEHGHHMAQHSNNLSLAAPHMSSFDSQQSLTSELRDTLLQNINVSEFEQLMERMSEEMPDISERINFFFIQFMDILAKKMSEKKYLERVMEEKIENFDKQLWQIYEDTERQVHLERMKLLEEFEKKESNSNGELQKMIKFKQEEIDALLQKSLELEEKITCMEMIDSERTRINRKLQDEKSSVLKQLEESRNNQEALNKDLKKLHQRLSNNQQNQSQITDDLIMENMKAEKQELSKQLELLKEYNRKLMDDKDEMEARDLSYRSSSATTNQKFPLKKHGSIMADYFGNDSKSELPFTDSRNILNESNTDIVPLQFHYSVNQNLDYSKQTLKPATRLSPTIPTLFSQDLLPSRCYHNNKIKDQKPLSSNPQQQSTHNLYRFTTGCPINEHTNNSYLRDPPKSGYRKDSGSEIRSISDIFATARYFKSNPNSGILNPSSLALLNPGSEVGIVRSAWDIIASQSQRRGYLTNNDAAFISTVSYPTLYSPRLPHNLSPNLQNRLLDSFIYDSYYNLIGKHSNTPSLPASSNNDHLYKSEQSKKNDIINDEKRVKSYYQHQFKSRDDILADLKEAIITPKSTSNKKYRFKTQPIFMLDLYKCQVFNHLQSLKRPTSSLKRTYSQIITLDSTINSNYPLLKRSRTLRRVVSGSDISKSEITSGDMENFEILEKFFKARIENKNHARSYSRISELMDPLKLPNHVINHPYLRCSPVGLSSTSDSYCGSTLKKEDSSDEFLFTKNSTSKSSSSNSQKDYGTKLLVRKTALRDPKRVFKVIIIGDMGVGKSTFIHMACHKQFCDNFLPTLGMDFQVKSLDMDGQSIALQIWDTAGQERFKTLTRHYYRKADAILLMYDINQQKSLANLKGWINEIRKHLKCISLEPNCCTLLYRPYDDLESMIMKQNIHKPVFVILANKMDLIDLSHLTITSKELHLLNQSQNLANDIDALHFDVSSKTGLNVEQAFRDISRLLCSNEDLMIKTPQISALALEHFKRGEEGKHKKCSSSCYNN